MWGLLEYSLTHLPAGRQVTRNMGNKDNKKVESLVIFKCNCRCLMCSVGVQINRSAGSDNSNIVRSFESVKKDIDKAAELGASEFAFSGGEPTLRKDLADLVEYAGSKGFDKIEIQSNGRIYANRYYGEKMIKSGVNSFVVSFHSPKRDINDTIMGVPGAFDEQVAGIRNLNDLGQPVKVNVVITKFNYKDLAEHVSFLTENFNIEEIRLTFALLEGYAKEDPGGVVAPMSLVSPHVSRALEKGRQKTGCFVYNMVPCLLPGYERYINDLAGLNTWLVGPEFSTSLDESKAEEKIKTPACSKCAYNRSCPGVWKEYARIFGLDEIKPIYE